MNEYYEIKSVINFFFFSSRKNNVHGTDTAFASCSRVVDMEHARKMRKKVYGGYVLIFV